MTQSATKVGAVTAGRFDRPLLLTARQDLAGYLLGHAGRLALLAVTATSVVAVLAIFAFIIMESAPFIAGQGLSGMLGSTHWNPDDHGFGALSLIAGSMYVTVGAMLLAVPVGLLTAVFLSDIVSFRIRQIVKPIVELLAAIPSVAYGFFAVLVVAPYLQDHWGLSTGTNVLNASLMLALMAVPTIVSVSEDSLSALGRELREGSYACGATRAETVFRVVIPAAHNGIIAALILGMMRAVGETMVVWMAAGNASQIPHPWWNLAESVRTLTATIAGDMSETPVGSDHYRALFSLGLTLLVFTFTLNLVTESLLRRFRRRAGGVGK